MTIFAQNRALLVAFREGRREALEQVYWAYVDLVTTVVRRQGPQLGYDSHCDLVQETFSRAFSRKTRLGYDGLHAYRPYLLAICRNVVADWFRQRSREVPAETHHDDVSADVESLVTDDPSWADPTTVAIVERYLASLAPTLGELYQLRYVEGCSQEQTALRMRSSRQKVRTLENRLRAGLERLLKKHGCW